METLHLHVLPFLHIFAKAEGGTGCCYKPFAAATDLHLLHQGRWLETTSMQPQSILYPENPSAGCQICFHIDQLLFSHPLNKKTVFIQLLFFSSFTNADTCNKFLFKEADHSKAVYYESESKGHYQIVLAHGTDFSQYPKSPGLLLTPSACQGRKQAFATSTRIPETSQ